MMMPNGWVRLRASTSSKETPKGYIYLSLYEYGAQRCSSDTIQIQHGTVTGVCVAGQDVYGDIKESGSVDTYLFLTFC